MAGSYEHLLDKRGNFTFEYIENMGDAREACEDCFNQLQKLKREYRIVRTKQMRQKHQLLRQPWY